MQFRTTVIEEQHGQEESLGLHLNGLFKAHAYIMNNEMGKWEKKGSKNVTQQLLSAGGKGTTGGRTANKGFT